MADFAIWNYAFRWALINTRFGNKAFTGHFHREPVSSPERNSLSRISFQIFYTGYPSRAKNVSIIMI